jgi:hypothetical protein
MQQVVSDPRVRATPRVLRGIEEQPASDSYVEVRDREHRGGEEEHAERRG